MMLIFFLSFFAGFFIKDLDYRIDELKNINNSATLISFTFSTIFLSFLVLMFPEVMIGVILGTMIMGKTIDPLQFLLVIPPLYIIIMMFYSGLPIYLFLLFYSFILSIMDEMDISFFEGARPALPIGMLILYGLTGDTYVALSTFSLLSFDLGYILKSSLNN